MFRLKKWHLQLIHDGYAGFGDCYGNPEFFDGTFIRTSYVTRLEAEDKKGQMMLFTRQGECYVLDYADISEESLEDTRKVLEGRGIAVDLGKCVALRRQKAEATKKRMMDMLKPGELYAAVASGWDVVEAYFKTGEGTVIPVPVKEHTGTWQDSVRVAEKGICDWRIYVSCFLVRPYFWSDNISVVRIENVGSDFMFQGAGGEILCKSGEITAIERKEFTQAGFPSSMGFDEGQ
ncbi:MAG: hypothetical protein NC548_25355 [Lachnospiraceae bacterium]|nr:hypothetical protein [Lachnospiraceae bacterium]